MEKLTEKIISPILVSEKLKSLGFSRSNVLKLLKNKDVIINGKRTKDDVFLMPNDSLEVFYHPSQLESIEVIFEDENILIVNKPYGIEVEGDQSIAKKLNVIAVHRLDRNTTGILVLAKNRESEKSLLKAFKDKSITKKYYAEVDGKTNYKNFQFNAFLVKDSRNSKVKIFENQVANSVKISTIFNTIKSSTSSLIECTLLTGKTHQIRASLAYLGYPIIGDGKYGTNEINKRYNEFKQRLHSCYLKFESLSEPLNYLNGKNFTCNPQWLKKR